LQQVTDALDDGIILVAGSGAIALVNRRLEEMFGYLNGTLAGQPVTSLIPAGLPIPRAGERAGYPPNLKPGKAGTTLHRVGVRRHGSTFPVRISVRLAAAGTSRFTLAVVQDITYAHPLPSRGDRARAAALSGQAHSIVLTLDRAVSRLFSAGLSLQSAISRPPDQARYLIGDAVGDLDAVIGDIRRLVFSIERRSGARSRDSRNRYGLLLVRRAVRTCGAPSSISPPPLRRAGAVGHDGSGAGMTDRRRHRGPCRRDQGPPGAGPWSLAVTRQDVVNW
jgi:PAS domain S-box-containing protein